jgi:hypothetical protein
MQPFSQCGPVGIKTAIAEFTALAEVAFDLQSFSATDCTPSWSKISGPVELDMNSRLPNLLLNNNLLSQEQYLIFKSRQKDSGNTVLTELTKLGAVDEEQIASFLASYYDIEKIDLEKLEIPEAVRKLLSPEFIQKYQVLPIKRNGKTLQVALVDPSIDFVLEDIKFITGFNVQPSVVTETQFLRALEMYYHMGGTLDKILRDINDEAIEVVDTRGDIERDKLLEEIDAAPIVKLLDGIIADAVQKGASDIHIEPYEHTLRVRFRIDGVLAEVMSPHRRAPHSAGRPYQDEAARPFNRPPYVHTAHVVRREGRDAYSGQVEPDS